MDKLQQELKSWSTKPFEYGKLDCMLAPCNWVMSFLGVDPGLKWRNMYSTIQQCDDVTGYLHNPVRVTQDCIDTVGLGVTHIPKRGDIGVVLSPDRQIVGGVYCGNDKWASKADPGVTMWVPEKIYRAWSVGYEE